MENLIHKVMGITAVVIGFLSSNGVIAHNPSGGYTVIGVGGAVLLVNRYATALETRIAGLQGTAKPTGLEAIAGKMLAQVEKETARKATVDPTIITTQTGAK